MEQGSDVEQRVLRAAKKLFFAQGATKTPLRAIAAEAGTSESGVLRFFQDKDDLLRAVMALCWDDVNDHLGRVVRSAAERSDDPRYLLVELVRGALEQAARDRRMLSFLVSHFRFTIAIGSDGDLPARRQDRLDGYREYRRRIDQLCAHIVADNPDLPKAGISQLALCHLTLSLIYGVSGGWFMAERDSAVHGEKVSLEDVLAVLRRVLYGDGSLDGDGSLEGIT